MSKSGYSSLLQGLVDTDLESQKISLPSKEWWVWVAVPTYLEPPSLLTINLNIWFHHALGQQWVHNPWKPFLLGPYGAFPHFIVGWLLLHRPNLPIRYPVPAVSSKQLTVAWKRHSRLQRLPPWIHCNAQIYCLGYHQDQETEQTLWTTIVCFIIHHMINNIWTTTIPTANAHHESWCCSFLQQPSQTWSWETALVQGVVGQVAHAVVHVCLVRRFLSDCRNFSSYCLSNQAP